MSQVKNIRFQSKVDSKSEWEKNNPKLLNKEIGYERENGSYKIGDGIHNWNDLPYAEFGGGAGQKTKDGGEIFNDYENNKAVSEYSHASGSNTCAGHFAFSFKEHEYTEADYDTTNNIGKYYLNTVEGIVAGLNYTIVLYNNFGYQGVVNSVGEDYIEVTNYLVPNSDSTKTIQYDSSYIIFPDKPAIQGDMLIGYAANSEGYNTNAMGKSSYAEGGSTIASGQYSHAEGKGSKAGGYASHAETSGQALGHGSHAESLSITKGEYSHGEGRSSAIGNQSHAEGQNTVAKGTNSHAEGYNTSALGENAHAEGKGTHADSEASHAEGGGTFAEGYASHAEGYETQALNKHSHAEGNSTIAEGYASHAEGKDTHALGENAHAEGQNTYAKGKASHAEGSSTSATGSTSHAEGSSTKASAYASHAEGADTQAIGSQSHVEGMGSNTTINGQHGHAEGYYTSVDALGAHAEGSSTVASGKYAHAEGSTTTAQGYASHAEGHRTSALGENAHAEGSYTNATGSTSHAEGHESQAIGITSHAEGKATYALSAYQHVQGKYNIVEVEHEEEYQGNIGEIIMGDLVLTYDKNFEQYPLLNIVKEPTVQGDIYIFTNSEFIKNLGKYKITGLTRFNGKNLEYGDKIVFPQDLSQDNGNYYATEYVICYFKEKTYDTQENIIYCTSGTNEGVNGFHSDGFTIMQVITKPTKKYAHIVGNGTDGSNRSNAHTLDWEGNAWFAGDVYSKSGTNADYDEEYKLITKKELDEAINTLITAIKEGAYWS